MNLELTQYGYSNDPYGDSLTRAGFGAWGNKLTPASCALKASTARLLGIEARGKVLILLANGRYLIRFFDDHIPETDPGERCDLYMPNGYDDRLPDRADIHVIPDLGFTPCLPLQVGN